MSALLGLDLVLPDNLVIFLSATVSVRSSTFIGFVPAIFSVLLLRKLKVLKRLGESMAMVCGIAACEKK